MKIMMPVEVVNERCPYCRDFDADVVTQVLSGMEIYDQDPKKAANSVTVLNEIRCTHFAECEWRAKNILGPLDPTKNKPEKKEEKHAAEKKTPAKKEPAGPRKKAPRKESV